MRRLLPGVKIILFLAFGFLIGLGIRIGLSWFDPTAAPPALNSSAPINVSDSVQIKEGGLNLATVSGSVGVGTTTPASLLSVGSSSQFQVDSSGNLVRINNIPYSWPSVQGGASTFLQNNGSGNLSWAAPSPSAGPNLVFTQGTLLSAASQAVKDARCVNDFGANYAAATRHDVAAYASMGLITVLPFVTVDFYDTAYLYADAANNFNRLLGSVQAEYPLACVKKDAPLRFTRATVYTSDSVATKDSRCVTAFGSAYQAASVRDVAAGARLGGSSLEFATVEAPTFLLNMDTTSDFNYIAQGIINPVILACIRIN